MTARRLNGRAALKPLRQMNVHEQGPYDRNIGTDKRREGPLTRDLPGNTAGRRRNRARNEFAAETRQRTRSGRESQPNAVGDLGAPHKALGAPDGFTLNRPISFAAAKAPVSQSHTCYCTKSSRLEKKSAYSSIEKTDLLCFLPLRAVCGESLLSLVNA